MSAITVRGARPDDAAAICRIYNQGIADRIATLETELRTPEERRAWMAGRGPRHPVVVAEAMSNGASTAPLEAPDPERVTRAKSALETRSHLVSPTVREPSGVPLRPPALPAQAVPGGGSAGGQGPPASQVVGWGSLNSYNPRDAYRHVADFSVYVERDWRGKGVGRRLLERLVELARDLGYHKMMLSAFPFNASGLALYERLGFTTVGICREMGRLDGKWVDTIIMEKLL